MHGLDVRIFHWINQWSPQWSGLFVFFSEATKDADVRIGIAVIFLLLLGAGPTTRKAGLTALATLLVSNSFAEGFKHMFHMLRPCVELDQYILYVGKLDSFGTASSHAANMAALAFVFCYYFKWWGIPWALAAIITGLSRIYVGVHYPSQVLLGFLCGLFSAFLVIKTWEAFLRMRSSKTLLDPSTGATSR